MAGIGLVPAPFRRASGTLANRPTAAVFGVGYYFATDVNGGTLYQSDGSVWAQVAAGATQPAGTKLGGSAPLTADFLPTLAANTPTAVTGVAYTATTSGPVRVTLEAPSITHATAGALITLSIYADGAEVARSTMTVPTAAAPGQMRVTYEATPTAGSHTWAGYFQSNAAGTAGCFANGGKSGPFISVYTA